MKPAPQPPWMTAAWREYGQRESPGAATNPRIALMLADCGHPGHPDETPWCAAFVGAVLKRAGLAGTGSLRARSYLEWGVPVTEPVPGAIAVLSRTRDPALGHVGFVVGHTASHIFLLGGNQDNAVTVQAFERARVLGFRLPAAASSPSASLPTATEEARFNAALAHVLAMEGGWSDDPHDPGGPTNKGITLETFARATGRSLEAGNREQLLRELAAIDDALVRRLYFEHYWRPSRALSLPAPLALMHFDASVNHGLAGAARLLQAALEVEVDGVIGPITLRAAQTKPIAASLERYAELRRRRYRALPHFWRFGRGWLRRVDATLAAARRMATHTPSDPPKPSPATRPDQELRHMSDPTEYPHPTATAPAAQRDVTGPNGKWWGHSMTIWGALITTLTTVLPVLGKLFGLSITPDLVERLGQELIVLIQALGGVIGTVMTILGRARASTQLQRRPVKLKL